MKRTFLKVVSLFLALVSAQMLSFAVSSEGVPMNSQNSKVFVISCDTETISDGVVLCDFEDLALLAEEDAHLKGPLLGTAFVCVQHNYKLLAGGKYACLYEVYSLYRCISFGHPSDCCILILDYTEIGWYSH